ncbi:MAG: DoxX family membrane protein [Pedobacter sp.]|jgi:putative oxidoreductase|nr:MAG: DoxX family membrane protein [Pedobacter sp.]
MNTLRQKILNIVSALFGLMMINGGLNKFFNYMPVPEDLNPELIKDFNAIGEISWLMGLIGSAELIGGILLLFPRTRALGILVLFPVMVGVLLTHIYVDPSTLLTAVVIWIIMLWIIYEDRKKFMPLLQAPK